MKKINLLLLFFVSFFSIDANAQLNMNFVGQLGYGQDLNDIWGYAAPDGTEYALVGTRNSFSIVSLADPANPTEVASIPGSSTTWRDIKTWGETAYVTCDACPDGLLVVDLSDLPNSAPFFHVTDTGIGTLGPAHNIYIDEFGYAYLAGSNLNNGGMIYFDCFTTPGNPIFAGTAPSVYSHDVFVRDNKMFSSEINAGVFTIYDVTDKTNTVALGSQETAFTFTHNSWLSDNNEILFTTDEQANAPVGAYDVSDPTDIVELDQFRPLETLGDGVVPHNVHVWNDYLIISYYTDGCIIVDAAVPDNLVEVGNFDTFIPTSTGFSGAWGAYPFLPSGLVLVSDIGNGLFVLEPNYIRACYFEGNVIDGVTTNAISGAKVTLETTNVEDLTDAFGDFRTGYAIAGTYNATFSAPGYESTTIPVDLINGEFTVVNVSLTPLIPFSVSGNVTDMSTNEVIPEAQVFITDGELEYAIQSDATGAFSIPEFFEGEYEVRYGSWGYKSTIVNFSASETSNQIQLQLEPGYEDNFLIDLGWTVSGSAFSGAWELGEPIGVFVDQPGFTFFAAPDMDLEEDLGNSCYVTMNSADLFDAVLGGVTRVTSPSIDMTDWGQPMFSIYHYFFNVNVNTIMDGNSAINFKVNNGIETKQMSSFNPDVLTLPEWVQVEHNIADFIDITDDMSFIIDISNNNNSEIAEGAIDFLQVFDANPNAISTPIAEGVSVEVFPNPSDDHFIITYDIESRENAFLEVTNILGQQISKISLENNIGQTNIGATLDAGIYFVQIENAGLKTVATKIVKQ